MPIGEIAAAKLNEASGDRWRWREAGSGTVPHERPTAPQATGAAVGRGHGEATGDMEPAAGREVLMAQIGVAGRPGRSEPWVFGLSRTGSVYEYDTVQRGWRPLQNRVPGMVLIQLAVAERPGGEQPAVFGVTAAGNTMRYDFHAGSWWPLERSVLERDLPRDASKRVARSLAREVSE
jgi:hypothetical protein